MATKQKLKCSVCNTEFEYEEDGVLTLFNESPESKRQENVEVVAYLECPNGHLRPYKIKKNYQKY